MNTNKLILIASFVALVGCAKDADYTQHRVKQRNCREVAVNVQIQDAMGKDIPKYNLTLHGNMGKEVFRVKGNAFSSLVCTSDSVVVHIQTDVPAQFVVTIKEGDQVVAKKANSCPSTEYKIKKQY